jgi:hypothetical protein
MSTASGLGHVDPNPKRSALSDIEKRLASSGATRADEIAALDVARGDDAIERRDYLLEALHLQQARYVGAIRCYIRLRSRDVRLRGCYIGDTGVVGLHRFVNDLL